MVGSDFNYSTSEAPGVNNESLSNKGTWGKKASYPGHDVPTKIINITSAIYS